MPKTNKEHPSPLYSVVLYYLSDIATSPRKLRSIRNSPNTNNNGRPVGARVETIVVAARSGHIRLRREAGLDQQVEAAATSSQTRRACGGEHTQLARKDWDLRLYLFGISIKQRERPIGRSRHYFTWLHWSLLTDLRRFRSK